MRAPLVIFFAAVLVAGSGLAIMNNACKSGYRTWCAPTAGTQAPPQDRVASRRGGPDPETEKPAPFSKVAGL